MNWAKITKTSMIAGILCHFSEVSHGRKIDVMNIHAIHAQVTMDFTKKLETHLVTAENSEIYAHHLAMEHPIDDRLDLAEFKPQETNDAVILKTAFDSITATEAWSLEKRQPAA